MSERASQLAETADRQITELVTLLRAAGPTDLRRPCPGREKLGDGTVAAVAAHTADTYCGSPNLPAAPAHTERAPLPATTPATGPRTSTWRG